MAPSLRDTPSSVLPFALQFKLTRGKAYRGRRGVPPKMKQTPEAAVSSAELVEVQSNTPKTTTALLGAADTFDETTEVQISAPDTVASRDGDISAKRVETRSPTPDTIATSSSPLNDAEAHIANTSSDQISNALEFALGPKCVTKRKHRNGVYCFYQYQREDWKNTC